MFFFSFEGNSVENMLTSERQLCMLPNTSESYLTQWSNGYVQPDSGHQPYRCNQIIVNNLTAGPILKEKKINSIRSTWDLIVLYYTIVQRVMLFCCLFIPFFQILFAISIYIRHIYRLFRSIHISAEYLSVMNIDAWYFFLWSGCFTEKKRPWWVPFFDNRTQSKMPDCWFDLWLTMNRQTNEKKKIRFCKRLHHHHHSYIIP